MGAPAQAWQLPRDLLGLLSFDGYVGGATPTLPRMPELRDSLKHIAKTSVPQLGGAGDAQSGMSFHVSNSFRWDAGLPPDFKRAATEIYRTVRFQGYLFVRDYMCDNFSGDKGGTVFANLWILSQQIDFMVSTAARSSGDHGIFALLASSDELELGLRRIAAYIYQERTKDKAGV